MKYHCEVWVTKPNEFLIDADSIEDAKKKVSKIVAEKLNEGEKKVGQFIHEVDDDFELWRMGDVYCVLEEDADNE